MGYISSSPSRATSSREPGGDCDVALLVRNFLESATMIAVVSVLSRGSFDMKIRSLRIRRFAIPPLVTLALAIASPISRALPPALRAVSETCGVRANIGTGPASEAAGESTPRQLLDALVNDVVDPEQIYVLRDATLNRDRIRLYFNRGFLAFLKPVEGIVTGAIFAGDGEVLLVPPNPVEKQSLSLFTGSPVLEEHFGSAYLRFTDSTPRDLMASARKPEADDPDQPNGLKQRWDPLVLRLNLGNAMRILQDLAGGRDRPFFTAAIGGKTLGTFQVTDDERMSEAVGIKGFETRRGITLVNHWCSFPSRNSAQRQTSLIEGSHRVASYSVNTHIHDDNALEAEAELEVESLNGDDRVIVFQLAHGLSVTRSTELSSAGEHPVVTFQYPAGQEKPEITIPGASSPASSAPAQPESEPSPGDTGVDDQDDPSVGGEEIPSARTEFTSTTSRGPDPAGPSRVTAEANRERENDWITVVLPKPHPAGERFRLKFAYHGKVIDDAGNGVLYVGAHGDWYPNCTSQQPASYDLTFHYPARLTLVATGRRLDGVKEANGEKVSRWVSESTLPVAGFNLGPYDVGSRRAGAGNRVALEVYATREAEAALQKLNSRMPAMPGIATPQRGPEGRLLAEYGAAMMPSPAPPLTPSALLSTVLDSAAQSVEYFETLFGPYPYPQLAISQIPGNFGQGWPELVFLPTVSFLPPSTRAQMGLETTLAELTQRTVIPHEIAHQWWGNEVGWRTYHDQWLAEGFATYASALEIAREKDGERHFHQIMQGYKHDLLARTREGRTVDSGGPIWLGVRLSNSENPDGYNEIVYKKACWALHMLRQVIDASHPRTGTMAITGGTARADEPFFKMLREFIATYRHRYPSTEDFIRVASKYLPASADLDHNRRIEWFFDDWVYGTGIPSYKLESKVRRDAAGRTVVQGRIEQSGVPDGFEMLVPVVAVTGKDRKLNLGTVAVSNGGATFRFTATSEPARVAIDEDAVLAEVR